MNSRISANLADLTSFCVKSAFTLVFQNKSTRNLTAFGLIFILFFGFALPLPFNSKMIPWNLSPVTPASATNTYYNFTGGNLSFSVTPSTVDMITTNDTWTNVPAVEGYMGRNLTATHGVDPQTVVGTEFTGNLLPSAGDTQINANKGNPSAYNAGGLTEFDKGDYLAIGFQGNVQANPYLVFYLDTTGRTTITVNYQIIDIDSGSNDSVSPIALQYRVGEAGNFTNLPDGYVADATDGPNLSGRVTSKSVLLPPDAANQPQVQVRLITTNAAGTDGNSTPDEWVGVNNIFISAVAPTAASATAGGRVYSPSGGPLSDATVIMYDAFGNTSSTNSDKSGYFQFTNLQVGETYVFEVRSSRVVFSQPIRVLTLLGDYNDVNFYASPIPGKEPTIRRSKNKGGL